MSEAASIAEATETGTQASSQNASSDAILGKDDFLAKMNALPLDDEPAAEAEAAVETQAEAEAEAEAAVAPPPTPPPTAEVPDPTKLAEQQLEHLRGELKRSNLDPNVKKALSDSYYRDRAYSDAGFTVQDARTFKELGFTPDRAMRLAQAFPTDEIAEVTVKQAHAFQSVLQDFRSDPTQFLLKLGQTDRDATASLLDTVKENIPQLWPEYEVSLQDRFAQRLISALEAEAAESEDEGYKEAVSVVSQRVLPNRGKTNKPAPPDPRMQEMERRIQTYEQRERQIREQQSQQYAQARQQFTADVQGTAYKAVASKIDKMIPTAVPAQAKGELVEAILGDVVRLATGNKTLMNRLEALLQHSQLDQQGFDQAVNFATQAASGLIGPAAKARLDKWTTSVIATQEARAASVATAAAGAKAPPKVATTSKSPDVSNKPLSKDAFLAMANGLPTLSAGARR